MELLRIRVLIILCQLFLCYFIHKYRMQLYMDVLAVNKKVVKDLFPVTEVFDHVGQWSANCSSFDIK